MIVIDSQDGEFARDRGVDGSGLSLPGDREPSPNYSLVDGEFAHGLT